MKEIDILFDTTPGLFTELNDLRSMIAYGGNLRSLEAVALHEFGHGLAFAHEQFLYSNMGRGESFLSTNGFVARPYIGEDMARGTL